MLALGKHIVFKVKCADKCSSWEGGNGLPDSREFFLCVVVQVGLLLRLHFDYLGKRVKDNIKFMR